MHFSIPYAKQNIEIEVPDENVISFIFKQNKKKVMVLDENKIIREAIDNPVKTQKLSSLACHKKNACILVSDITRPCPSYKFLPYIIDELKKAAVSDIKVLFGLGIHRKHTLDEKIKLVGGYVAENAKLIDFDIGDTVLMGKTSFGTPVEISRQAASSDFLVATGNIEYHYFAGYSGGAKAVMPGICSRNSVSANHKMMLRDSAVAASFGSNPVRKDIEEAGKIAGIDFIFNVILDDNKNIIAAISGKNNEAFIEGINIYDSIYEISSSSKADLMITSPGGHPKDINLYQAQKAIDNVKDIAKEGSIILLVAACTEGFGEDKFEEWMQKASQYYLLYKRINEKFVLGGHKAVAISKLMTNAKLFAYSQFDKKTLNNINFEKVDDLQDFINKKIKKDKNIKITVVTNGRYVKYKPK